MTLQGGSGQSGEGALQFNKPTGPEAASMFKYPFSAVGVAVGGGSTVEVRRLRRLMNSLRQRHRNLVNSGLWPNS